MVTLAPWGVRLTSSTRPARAPPMVTLLSGITPSASGKMAETWYCEVNGTGAPIRWMVPQMPAKQVATKHAVSAVLPARVRWIFSSK